MAFLRKGSVLYRGEWEWETWKELPRLSSACAVILHNLCILFSDNGDDPLDDADLDIEEDELDIDNRETRGQTTAVAAALPMSVKNKI